jgi:hypothetical protein
VDDATGKKSFKENRSSLCLIVFAQISFGHITIKSVTSIIIIVVVKEFD